MSVGLIPTPSNLARLALPWKRRRPAQRIWATTAPSPLLAGWNLVIATPQGRGSGSEPGRETAVIPQEKGQSASVRDGAFCQAHLSPTDWVELGRDAIVRPCPGGGSPEAPRDRQGTVTVLFAQRLSCVGSSGKPCFSLCSDPPPAEGCTATAPSRRGRPAPRGLLSAPDAAPIAIPTS